MLAPMTRPSTSRASALVFLLVISTSLAWVFQRSLVHGEIFSPADLLFSYYPWAYDGPRIVPSNPTRSDEVVYHQPLMTTHFSRIRRGDLPEWDPSTLSGAPAFFQGLNTGMIFSPLSVPFYLLPPHLAVTVYAPLRLLCAGVFMWIFLRSIGMGALAGLGGSLAFSLSAPLVIWLSAPMPTVALFLPLALLFGERVARHGRVADAAALGLVLGLQFTGAYLPTSLVVLVMTGAYAAWWLASAPGWRPTALVIGAFAVSVAIGAAVLVPTLGNLLTSPAGSRSMADVHLPVTNLATFVMPDFFGNPTTHNWWYPGEGNYPEFVSYLGVTTLVLAGAAAGHRPGRQRWRLGFFALAAGFVLLSMYGIPPATWIAALPGFRQMNPVRWNSALAAATAVLAAGGIQALVAPVSKEEPSTRPWWSAAGAVGIVLLLGAIAAAALAQYLPDIRSRNLQQHEKAQLVRFGLLATAAAAPFVLRAWTERRLTRRWLGVAGVGLVLLVAADLVSALGTFNPTVARDRYHPDTPGLRYLQRHASGARIAPIGDPLDLISGHVWSVYGIASVTGFDFHGDPRYQDFLARASGTSAQPAVWDHIGIPDPRTVDLKLLGLLGARYLVASPVASATRGGGFETVGELTTGRVLRQTFTCPENGLRRVDLLTATFGRQNAGRLAIRVEDLSTRVSLVSDEVDAAGVPNNDWLTIPLPIQRRSKGRRYVVEIRSLEGDADRSPTLWTSRLDAYPEGALELDGVTTDRDLHFRAFASAPDRWPDATLVFARDLNIYRNELARPRAWFVSQVEAQPIETHLDRLTSPEFATDRRALVDVGGPDTRSDSDEPEGDLGSVLTVDVSQPDERRLTVDAPRGGFLVISERYHAGWRAEVDGREVPLRRANGVLMGVTVPPGARTVTLGFRQPWLRPAVAVSALSLAATGLVLVMARRRRPTIAPV